MPDRLRVVIADDHPLFREGVVHSLSLEEDIEVVAEAANGKEAVRLATELLPDIVVMDLVCPRPEELKRLVRLQPQCQLLPF